MIRIGLMVLLTIGLAGCVTPTTTGSQNQSREQSLPLRVNERVLFQGDSITDMNRGRNADPNHILGHSYAFLIAARWGSEHPEQNWTFINRGISGNKVSDLQKRWKTDALELKPTILSILIGINDQSAGLAVSEYERQYDELLTTTRTALPDVSLVLCEPFALPIGRKVEPWDAFHQQLSQRQTIVARLARKHHAIFVPLQPVFDDACRVAPATYWIWDGIHPTYAGQQLIANQWMKIVSAAGLVRERTTLNPPRNAD